MIAAMTAKRRISGVTGRPHRRGANRLRIIGGDWRSRIVRFPDAEGLRPTPDRVRETLFNWLGQRLDGLACVDLFAGSGALGLEARSRGAARVVLVEQDRRVCEHLRRTARELEPGGRGSRSCRPTRWRGSPLPASVTMWRSWTLPTPRGSPGPPSPRWRGRPQRGGSRVRGGAAALEAPSAAWRKLREGAAGAVKFALYEFAGPAGAKPTQETEP